MYSISRICLGNYGHQDARFKSNFISFENNAGEVSDSAVLFAPNGNGKTTLLSLMLHLFCPRKTDFVQTKQKPTHKFEHYFEVGKPGYIVMELTKRIPVKGATDAYEDKPALVIGAIIDRNESGYIHEEFFLIDGNLENDGFGHIDFIKKAIGQRNTRLTVSKPEIDAWKRAAVTRKTALRTYTTQDEWQKALTAAGLNIKSFEVMVKMASREGGIEKFLDSSDPSVIHERLFDLFIDENDEAEAAVIEEIQRVTAKIAKLPQLEAQNQARIKLLELLKPLSSAHANYTVSEQSYTAHHSAALQLYKELITLTARSNSSKNWFESEHANLSHKIETDSQRLKEMKAQAEAFRRYDTTIKVQKLDGEISEIKNTIEGMAQKLEVIALSVPIKRHRELCNALKLLNDELAAIENKVNDQRAELYKAGTLYAAALHLKTKSILAELEVLNQQTIGRNESIKSYEIEKDTLKAEVTRKQHLIDTSLEARKKIAQICAEIANIAKQPCSSKDEACALRDKMHLHVQSSGQTITDLENEQQTIVKELARAQADIKRLNNEKTSLTDKAKKLETTLNSCRSSEVNLREKHLDLFFTGQDYDINGTTIENELHTRSKNATERLAKLNAKQVILEDRIKSLSDGGASLDADVKTAIKLCLEAGISDISTFGSWISSNITERSEAQEFAEKNLQFSLGLRLNNAADLVKIKRAFDRSKWNLSKPVPVTVVKSEAELKNASHDTEQYILSAASDYAYHDAARIADLKAAETALDAVKIDIQDATAEHARVSHAIKALQEHHKLYYGVSIDDLTVEIKGLNQAVTDKMAETATLTQLEAISTERAAEIVKDLKTHLADHSVLQTSHAMISKRVDQIPNDALASADLDALNLSIADARKQIKDVEAKIEIVRDINAKAAVEQAKLEQVIEAHVAKIAHIKYKHDDSSAIEANIPLDTAKDAYQAKLKAYEEQHSADQQVSDLKTDIASKEAIIAECATGFKKPLAALYAKSSEQIVDQQIEEAIAAISVSDIEYNETQVLADKARHEATLSQLLAQMGAFKAQLATQPHLEELASEIDACLFAITQGKVIRDETLTDDAIRYNSQQLEKLIEQASAAKIGISNAQAKILEYKVHETKLEHVISNKEIAKPLSDDIDIPERDWADYIAKTTGDLAQAKRQMDKHTFEIKRLYDCTVELLRSKNGNIGDEGILASVQRRRPSEYAKDAGSHVVVLSDVIAAAADDLSGMRTQKENLVNSVVRALKRAKDRVVAATSITVPQSAGKFSGLHVLKMPKGITPDMFTEDMIQAVAQQYVDEQLSKSAGAEAGIYVKSLSKLSIDLLNMFARAKGKDAFLLRVLKPSENAAQHTWNELHKLTGSGGQSVTATLLLVMVASSMGQSRIGSRIRASNTNRSFIILDNPIGQANKSSLVELQLSIAKSFGIQMVVTTGIDGDYIVQYGKIIKFGVEISAGEYRDIKIVPAGNQINTNEIQLRNPLLQGAK